MENLDPYLYLANVVQVATFMCECDLLAEDAVSSSARETALRVGGLAQVSVGRRWHVGSAIARQGCCDPARLWHCGRNIFHLLT